MQQILTRKQAIMEAAIPQQIRFMIQQGYPPTWEMFSRSSGWAETADNLQLAADERQDYSDRWRRHLESMMQQATGGGISAITN